MADLPTFILTSDYSRDLVCSLILRAERGSVVTIKPPRRSLDQNAKLHAIATEIARAKPEGRKYSIRVWKIMFLAMIGKKVTFEPALDGEGIVPINPSTSRLTKAECGELIDCMEAYAAQHGVELSQ